MEINIIGFICYGISMLLFGFWIGDKVGFMSGWKKAKELSNN